MRPLKTRVFLALATACAGLALAGAGTSCSTPETTPIPDTGAPIKFGATLALTNDLGGVGRPLKNGIEVARQQLNANGGVLGRRVEIEIVDDGSDSDAVLRGHIERFLGQGVSAILGPIGSGQVTSIAPLVFERQIIQLSATATSVKLSEMQPAVDRFFFRTVPADDLQAAAQAIFAIKGPAGAAAGDGGAGGCRKMVIVHNDDDYGNPFAQELRAQFERRGGTVADAISVPTAAQSNYDAQLSRIYAAKPECLSLITYDLAAVELVRQIRATQASDPSFFPESFFILGADSTYTSKLISEGRANKADPGSPTVVEGVLGTNPDPNPVGLASYGEFKNLYLAQFGFEPGQSDLAFGVAGIYDAVILAALAIQAAGTTDDPVAVRNALFEVSRGGKSFGPLQIGEALEAIRNGQDIDYTGASGDVNFDDRGNVVGDYIVWKVENGAFVVVDRVKASDLTAR